MSRLITYQSGGFTNYGISYRKYSPEELEERKSMWVNGENIHINFPGRGDYELEVFKMNNLEEKEAVKRYREYRKEKVEPEALYCFKVK